MDLELNFASWLANNGKNGQGHAEKSISAHISDLRVFIRWFEDHNRDEFSPVKITSIDLRAFAEESMMNSSAATWNRRRASLALFCEFCMNKGLIVFSPFQGIPRMAIPARTPKSLNKNDKHAFLRTVETAVNSAKTDRQRFLAVRNRAFISLLIYAGVRVGEVCELRRKDLLLTDRKGEILIRDGKGHKQETIPLGREGRIAVSQWLNLSPAGEYVFGDLTPRQIERIVKELGQQAGLDRVVTPHSCRHTFVYNVLAETHNLPLAQKLARHARIQTTAGYAAPHDDDCAAAVENL
jgi:site-specific recombinase XerD